MIITRLRRLGPASVIVIGMTAAAAWAASDVVEPMGQNFEIAKVPSGAYHMDTAHANVVFMVSHLGYSAYIGRFDAVDGTLKFNSKKPTKSELSVTIDPASVNVQSDKLKEHLKDKDFFDVATYPTMTFKSTSIEKLTDKTGRVTGDLTMHGVTKPVTLDVTFNGSGFMPAMGPDAPKTPPTHLGFSARGELKRSEFGMTYATQFLGDKVAIIIEAEFVQGPKDKPKSP